MKIISCFFIATAVLLYSGSFVSAQDEYGEIEISAVPAKVIRAAKKEIFAIEITSAERILTKDGLLLYELEGVKNQKKYFIQATAWGGIHKSGLISLLENEKVERRLSLLPEKVRKAAEKEKKGIRLTGFVKEREFGEDIFEVRGILENECFEIEVTPDGVVIESEKCD